MTALGEIIRSELARQELTQQQLATRMGVSLRTVSGWVGGATVPPERIPALERVLRISISRDGDGYRAASATATPPEIAGLDSVTTDGDGGRVTLYFAPGAFVGLSDTRRDQVIAAGRLAILRELADTREKLTRDDRT